MSKNAKDKQTTPNLSRKKLLKWLDSFERVSAAVEKHGDLVQLLEAGGGICKMENFLPEFVAEGIYDMLENFTEAEWNVTAADDDYTHNDISHEFLSTKSQTLEAIFRVFTLLLPDSLFTFSAAKYCRQGHIKPHDDRAFTQVCMDDGSIQLCSRNIAVIYYLTKDWTAADGGLLIDLEAPGGPQTHVPKFNSVISFIIPRWHEVTPVIGNRPRYSVFGWFLEPGKLYELQLDPQLPSQEQLQQRHKQKKRKKGAEAAAAAVAANSEQLSSPGQLQPKAKHKKLKNGTGSAAAAANCRGSDKKGPSRAQQSGNDSLQQQQPEQQQTALQPQQQQPAATQHVPRKQKHGFKAGSIAVSRHNKPRKQQLQGVQKLKKASKHKKNSKSKQL